MNKKIMWIVGAIIVIALALGVYIAMQKTPTTSSNTTNSSNQTAAATITYSASGFTPSSTTVKSGDTVAVKNTSSQELQMDSGPHPAHTDDTDLNIGAVPIGQTVTFTVTKKGTFSYHNHLNPSDEGSITIQ